MGFLAIVTRQTPAQFAIEREQLSAILDRSVTAIQSARQDVVTLHQQLGERLAQLPAEISVGINPAAIAVKLGESLRQQFVESGIPETAQALAVVSKKMQQTAGEFDRSSKQLTDSYRSAAKETRQTLDEMKSSIQSATATANRAANQLTNTFRREYKWSVFALCIAALLLGFALGIEFNRWTAPTMSEANTNTPVASPKPQAAPPSAPTNRATRKPQHKTKSSDAAVR